MNSNALKVTQSIEELENSITDKFAAELVLHQERASCLIASLKERGLNVAINATATYTSFGRDFGAEGAKFRAVQRQVDWAGWEVHIEGQPFPRRYSTLELAISTLTAMYPERTDYALFDDVWERRLEKIYARLRESGGILEHVAGSAGEWRLTSDIVGPEREKWFKSFTEMLAYIEKHFDIK